MTISFFEGCSLYESMIETDEQEEVEKVLFAELKKMGYDTKNQRKLRDIKYFDYAVSETTAEQYVDICLYFGVPGFRCDLENFIIKAIKFLTFHKIIRFGIILEKVKDLIITKGFERFVYSIIMQGSGPLTSQVDVEILTQREIYDLRSGEISDYLIRCLYYDEYLIGQLRERIKVKQGIEDRDKKRIGYVSLENLLNSGSNKLGLCQFAKRRI
jgi:hypothetical protein